MSLIINGSEIPNTGNVTYNGTDIEKVVCDGAVVWEKYRPPLNPDKEIEFKAARFWTQFVQAGGNGGVVMEGHISSAASSFGIKGSVDGDSDWFTPYYRLTDLLDCRGYSKLIIKTSVAGEIYVNDGGWHNNRLIVKKGSHVTSGNDTNTIILPKGVNTYEFDVSNALVSIAIGIDCKLPYDGYAYVGLSSITLRG